MDHAASPAKTLTDLNKNTVCHYSLHSKGLRVKAVGRLFSLWLSQLRSLPSSDLKFWATVPWSLPGIQQGSVFLSILIQDLLSFHQRSIFCNKNITAHKRSQNKEQQVEVNAKWQFMPKYIPAGEWHAYPRWLGVDMQIFCVRTSRSHIHWDLKKPKPNPKTQKKPTKNWSTRFPDWETA